MFLELNECLKISHFAIFLKLVLFLKFLRYSQILLKHLLPTFLKLWSECFKISKKSEANVHWIIRLYLSRQPIAVDPSMTDAQRLAQEEAEIRVSSRFIFTDLIIWQIRKTEIKYLWCSDSETNLEALIRINEYLRSNILCEINCLQLVLHKILIRKYSINLSIVSVNFVFGPKIWITELTTSPFL